MFRGQMFVKRAFSDREGRSGYTGPAREKAIFAWFRKHSHKSGKKFSKIFSSLKSVAWADFVRSLPLEFRLFSPDAVLRSNRSRERFANNKPGVASRLLHFSGGDSAIWAN